MTEKLKTVKAEPPFLVRESSLVKIKLAADRNPDLVFTSIAHRIDLHLLKRSYKEINKSKSTGIDKVTAKEYGNNLDRNLFALHSRLIQGKYRACPVKRIWIDKEGGKKRPIGIPSFEDKIVQKAVAILMSMIFDVNFYDFSYAFRSGFNQHMAIHQIRENCFSSRVNWIVSADITGLFDNIDHKLLIEIIKKRVNDGNILKLIGKWLKAGVSENDSVSYSDKGTPQGGVISPVLSNIFLHHVLDDWLSQTVSKYMKGKSFVIRYADDFILGFEAKEDALKVMEVLPKRFNKYGLELHPEKTQMIPFGKPGRTHTGKGLNTFDFLGFTFYWGKSLKGNWVIKKKTIGKRLRRSMTRLWEWCKENRHLNIKEQYDILCDKLRGYYQYYGVRSNYKSLEAVYQYLYRAWRYWLSKRGSNKTVFFDDLKSKFALPKPRIVHNI
jgi:group II intron reverse transcriptase/maturase